MGPCPGVYLELHISTIVCSVSMKQRVSGAAGVYVLTSARIGDPITCWLLGGEVIVVFDISRGGNGAYFGNDVSVGDGVCFSWSGLLPVRVVFLRLEELPPLVF